MRSVRFVLLAIFLAGALACTEDPEYKFTASPSLGSPPSSAVPETPISDLQASPVTSSTCGLDGTFGICEATTTSGVYERIYYIITGCSRVQISVAYYSAAHCEDADKFYERKLVFSMTYGSSTVVSGAHNVDLILTSINETLSNAAFDRADWGSYTFCDVLSSVYEGAHSQSFTIPVCFYSSQLSTVTDHQILKQTSDGLFLGTLCSGSRGICYDSGERPTSLQGSGLPNWN